jgi:hypothetical protein
VSRIFILLVAFAACGGEQNTRPAPSFSVTQTTALSLSASSADRLESGARFMSQIRGRITWRQRDGTNCVGVFPALGPNIGRFEMIRGRGFVTCRVGENEWSAPQPVILTAEGAGIQAPKDAVDLVVFLPSRAALEHHLALGTPLSDVRASSLGDGLLAPADLGRVQLEIDADAARPLYGADQMDAILGGQAPVPPVARDFVSSVSRAFGHE